VEVGWAGRGRGARLDFTVLFGFFNPSGRDNPAQNRCSVR
jgi:hypothetical protein